MLTADELNAIRERCEKATPGPWKPCLVGLEFGVPITLDGPYDRSIGEIMEWDDMEFIAHSRADIPALLAHIDELNARIKELEKP